MKEKSEKKGKSVSNYVSGAKGMNGKGVVLRSCRCDRATRAYCRAPKVGEGKESDRAA
jgi:hypothetical protein